MNKQIEPDNNVLDVLTSDETTLLQQLEGVVKKHEESVLEAAQALKEINEKRLYRATHKTFEAYMKDRFTWTRTSGYRLIEFAEVHENVSPEGYKVTKAAARVLAPLEPEKQQKVYQFLEAATGSKKPTTSQIKAVAELVEQIDASGTVSDPDTGEQVVFSELPEEKRVAVIRENVTTATHERMERQKTHIQEKAISVKWQEELLNRAQLLAEGQEVLLRIRLDPSNNPQVLAGVYEVKRLDALAEGEPKGWMKAAAMSLIEVLK